MLFAPGDFRPGSSPLEVAHSQLAVREEPPGSNRGSRVDYYNQLVGLPVPADPLKPGHPWCCSFQHFIHRACGRWFPRTAQVHRFAEIAAAHRLPPGAVPRPGDIGVHFSNAEHGHITMLNRGVDDAWEDISGNTDPKGSRNGWGVFLVVRPLAYYNGGFFRL